MSKKEKDPIPEALELIGDDLVVKGKGVAAGDEVGTDDGPWAPEPGPRPSFGIQGVEGELPAIGSGGRIEYGRIEDSEKIDYLAEIEKFQRLKAQAIAAIADAEAGEDRIRREMNMRGVT